MRILALAALFAALVVLPGAAQDEDPLAEYLWEKRPIVVFASSEKDPRLRLQLASLEARTADLEERDVVVIVDTEPGESRATASPMRKRFRPHDFTIILVDKDGMVKLRKPDTIDADALLRMIDRMPTRQEEMRSRR